MVQSFINWCLRIILRVFYPNTISIESLWKRTNQEMEIGITHPKKIAWWFWQEPPGKSKERWTIKNIWRQKVSNNFGKFQNILLYASIYNYHKESPKQVFNIPDLWSIGREKLNQYTKKHYGILTTSITTTTTITKHTMWPDLHIHGKRNVLKLYSVGWFKNYWHLLLLLLLLLLKINHKFHQVLFFVSFLLF